jgi:hypothetical protein
MDKRFALVVMLVGVGPAMAGVGVSPPGKISISVALQDAQLTLNQSIVAPDRGIVAPDRGFTSLTHLQVCYPPDPGLGCTPHNVQIKVTAADPTTAQAAGLLAAVGELAGIVGPDLTHILNKQFSQNLKISVIGNGSVVGIVAPDRATDVIVSALSATVPPGICVVSGPPQPCLQDLPALVHDGAASLGAGGSCAP